MRNKNSVNYIMHEHGFTLVEIIVAISVLTIGILSIAVLQTSSIQRNSKARNVTEASTLATDEMEYRMALNFQSAYLADDTYADDYTTNNNGYAINTDIRNLQNAYLGIITSKRITVNVSWSNFGSFGKQRTLTFENIKPRLRD